MSLRSLMKSSSLSPMFGDFFEPWNDWFTDGFPLRSMSMSMPKVNISEEDGHYNLSVAAPGLQKSDFKIDLNGNMITISANKEENKEEKKENFTRREYNYTSFSRTFTLPEEVEKDKIDASYTDGVLSVILPKTEKAIKAASKTIEVK